MQGMSEDEGGEEDAPEVKFDEEKAAQARKARAEREEKLRQMMEESGKSAHLKLPCTPLTTHQTTRCPILHLPKNRRKHPKKPHQPPSQSRNPLSHRKVDEGEVGAESRRRKWSRTRKDTLVCSLCICNSVARTNCHQSPRKKLSGSPSPKMSPSPRN